MYLWKWFTLGSLFAEIAADDELFHTQFSIVVNVRQAPEDAQIVGEQFNEPKM